MAKLVRMNENDKNCGLVAMQIASKLDYEKIKNSWAGGWLSDSTDKGAVGVPNDTPLDHFSTLEKLKLKFRIVTCNEILNGSCRARKTVILLHLSSSSKKTIWEKIKNWFRATLAQHWCVLESVDIKNQVLTVDWLYSDQKTKTFSFSEFEQLYSAGTPACAYEIGSGNYKVKWYQRLLAKISGKWI